MFLLIWILDHLHVRCKYSLSVSISSILNQQWQSIQLTVNKFIKFCTFMVAELIWESKRKKAKQNNLHFMTIWPMMVKMLGMENTFPYIYIYLHSNSHVTITLTVQLIVTGIIHISLCVVVSTFKSTVLQPEDQQWHPWKLHFNKLWFQQKISYMQEFLKAGSTCNRVTTSVS